MIMNNAIGHIGNVTSSNFINTNRSVPYWEYAALLQPLAANIPRTHNMAAQQAHKEQHPPELLLQQSNLPAFSRNDNHSHASAPSTAETTQTPASQFYSSFNISDDLFYYFNGFLERGNAPEVSTSPTPVESITTPAETFNVTSIPQEPDFSEFLSALPNDRVSLLSFLFLFSFATVFGNSLVILAVIRERYLHTATNYFITSLAVADCLVGLVVMPFSALYEVLENTWFFGTDWCDIWRSLDVLFSTASILNLCVISLDRYWAITDPFSYPMRMTVKRAAALICAVWVCSSAISFPAIVWWRAARDGEMPAYKCTFTEHLGYLVFSSTISFYLPLLVMVFTYCRIYRAAVIQTRSLKIGTKQVLMASGELQLTLRIHRGGTTREPSTSSHHQALHGSLGGAPSGGSQHHPHSHHHHRTSHHNHSAAGTTTSTPEEPDDEPLSALQNNGLARHRHMGGKNFSWSRKLAKFAKEKKAAKTLGIVMGVFIVCWLPFFVVNLLSGFCMECIEHEEIVSAVVTWLGWINSGMNPVIYACWSRDFRRAFVRILCVCCPRKIRRKYQPTMRSKSQCHVAAAMVAASTSFGYSSVNQFDGNRSIICSSCSGSSNCGRNSVVHHHHHHHPHHHQEQLQQQQQQQFQRERSCTRCQSFHRHHHRQRRRSSGVHYTAATNVMSNTTKAIVTVTPPITAGGASRLSTATTTSVSPTSLTSLSLASPCNLNNSGHLSGGATTPLHPGVSKHCTFALTPITIPPPPNKVSFLSTAKFHTNSINSSSATIATTPTLPQPPPNTLAATAAAISSIITPSTPPTPAIVDEDETAMVGLMNSHIHPKLEMRPSVTSQITTVEDVDEICKLPLDDECVDAVIHHQHRYSSPSSNSSLSLSSSAVMTRDNIVP
ncbi:Dopamine receptor 2 [Lucilia cuprina]|uniref:Dopamine receptor 2 n=1 Tax=Lucilia cuprina TaxID=7375 RepID=A0A0L0CEE5_LUCCU|nr:Dopamine receptor 2 [Lucilia cuprina]